MNENVESNNPIESKETLSTPDSVIIYVFRHGKCGGWETDKWKENGGIWDPDMIDLTDEGIEKVGRSAEAVSNLVDPEKQIAVMLSSPRARTKTTSNMVGEVLRTKGMDFFHDYGNFAPAEMAQFLRSRGDFSYRFNPTTGQDEIDDIHQGSVSNNVFLEKERDNTGWRMLEFLNYCATFFPEYFAEKPAVDPYKGKQPVLFLFTHNEVVGDMLTKLNIVTGFERKRGALPTGDFFELVCDLKNPGHFSVRFPDPEYQNEPVDFYIDLKTGKAISETGGELSFHKEAKNNEPVEDKTARDGQTYL